MGEAYHCTTKRCLFPVNTSDKSDFPFVISWHAEQANLVRVYWQFGSWTTRFFPMDAVRLWPMWFHDGDGTELKAYEKRVRMIRQVVDDEFQEWFEQTTETF